jgi:hypothetical protein
MFYFALEDQKLHKIITIIFILFGGIEPKLQYLQGKLIKIPEDN